METLINYLDPLMYKISEYGIMGNIITGLLATIIVSSLFSVLKCKRHSVSKNNEVQFGCFF